MSKLFPPLFIMIIACGTHEEPNTSPAFEATRATEVVPTEDTDQVVFAAPSPSIEEPPTPVETPELEPLLPARVPVHTFELRRGETLHHFARWSEQPIEIIAELSQLELDGEYQVGTEVKLILDAEERASVEARRDAHHQTRANNYLASRGSTRTDFYTVRTGDTAWTIARTFEGMPVWLLESMNPSVDLDTLRPGQELMVPVFNDVTVSVDETAPEIALELDDPDAITTESPEEPIATE